MNINLSRRRLLLGGGAAIISPLVFSRDRRAEAETVQVSASGHGVSVVLGSDPDFSSSLNVLYPGLIDDPAFQQIAPLALLVTHQQGPPVRAFSISWAITTPTGTREIPLYFYVSVGSPAKGHILSALGSARRDLLQVGQTRLVTPFFSWTPNYYAANSTPDWNAVLKPAYSGWLLVSEQQAGNQVDASLDGVLFSDWKLIGPDKHSLGKKIRMRRNAEHDEALLIYRLTRAGAPDSQIIQTLREHSSATASQIIQTLPRRSSASGPIKLNANLRWYAKARKVHAQVLLKAFDDTDRPTFSKVLVRLKKQRNTQITSLTV